MEVSAGPPTQPNIEKIKQKLLQQGVIPTPKIIHTIRKKELQKFNRRQAKQAAKQPLPLLTDSQKQALAKESHFRIIKSEYKNFRNALNGEKKMVGRPWERLEKFKLREIASENTEYGGEKLKTEHLRELSDIMESERRKLQWLLVDDMEIQEGWLENGTNSRTPPKRCQSEGEAIRNFLDRLSGLGPSSKDWKFSRIMKLSGLQFTEKQMMKIVEGLGERGSWRHALSVVDWIYNSKEHKHYKSRFVYTKLLSILGKARRPHEVLHIFNLMRGDAHIYPDMPAYHSVAVALGQAGLLKELLKVIQCMKEKPKKIKNMRHRNWEPELQPDIVIYNAVLNACVPSRQWKGVSWVFEQLRKSGLRPNGATYGLSMEVEKLKSVHRTRPLEVTFTGMILAAMDGEDVKGCLAIFEHCKQCCMPDIGIINAMLKVYGRNDMFLEARELFEEIKRDRSMTSQNDWSSSLSSDIYTFALMLEASASAMQWEYFEYVYKEMTLCGYQLHQSKHASLLVEASRAGKWHLLEHAFDAILEDGGIPHPSFFTEMVCQAVAQHDYKRAATLIDTMAYAPFQVSERQWIELFEENEDRISRDNLKQFSDALGSHHLATEATVLNLSLALQFLCGSSGLSSSLESVSSGNNLTGILPPDSYNGLSDDNGNTNLCDAPATIAGDSPSKILQVNTEDTSSSIDRLNHVSGHKEEDTELELITGLSSYSHSGHEGASPHTQFNHSDDSFACTDSDADDLNIEVSVGGDSDVLGSNIPSADEILENWKKMRKKDGNFFSFPLGRD